MAQNLWYCNAAAALSDLGRAADHGVDGLILEFAPSADLPCHGWSLIFDDLALYQDAPDLAKTGQARELTLRLRQAVNRIIDQAARRGMSVYIMGPELAYGQEALARIPALTDPTQEAMYRVTAARLAEIYDALPGLAGIKLYLDEGTINLNELASSVAPYERLRRLITALHEAGRLRDRTLIVSTFTLMPHQLQAIRRALGLIPADRHLVVDNYICPGDWGRIRLLNPAIGQVGGHREMISYDYCGEIWGQSVIPLYQGEFLRESWQACQARSSQLLGLAGYVSWQGGAQDGRSSALGTPSEATVYAAGRIARGAAAPGEDLALSWARARYGHAAAPFMASALGRTRDTVLKSWHDQGFWVHELPKGEFADLAWYHWSLHWESLAIWDEAYRGVERTLFYPTERTVAAVVAEKREALHLAQESLGDVERARPHLSAADHRELVRFFRRQLSMSRLFLTFGEAYYRARMWYTGRRDQEMRLRLLVGELRRLADEVEREADAGFWICRPERIRLVAGQLEAVLAGGPWPEVEGGATWIVSPERAAAEGERWQGMTTVEIWNEELARWGYAVS